jgi:hypothetical protein
VVTAIFLRHADPLPLDDASAFDLGALEGNARNVPIAIRVVGNVGNSLDLLNEVIVNLPVVGEWIIQGFVPRANQHGRYKPWIDAARKGEIKVRIYCGYIVA